MLDPLVSIHMITYNHAPFIAKAIDGVLQQQTNFPFELVIGEDCSKDGTREVVFEYQRKYPDIIRIISSDENIGMIKNSVRVTKACRGKYVAFCEGDDYWHRPDKLQAEVDYMENHPECGMVIADCDVYYPHSKRLIKSFNQRKGYRSEKNLSIEEIVFGGIVKFTCTVVVVRSIYNDIISRDPYLHQSGNFLLGDMQAWAEISTVSVVKYIPESMATYNVLSESATRSKNMIKHFRYLINVAEMKSYLCEKYKLAEEYTKLVEDFWCHNALRLALYERNPELANEVRESKKALTWKEWIRYYGARNAVAYRLYMILSSFLGVFKRKNTEWP